jgi:hypothetical protein
MRLWMMKKMVVLECLKCREIQDPDDVKCTGRCRFCGNELGASGVSA